MESKLNHSAIEAYTVSFANKSCSVYFTKEAFITGSQIIGFSNIKQINLFILKNLFMEWKRETEKLKSPYFNFQSVEVQRSFEDFKNVLSQNIKIDRLHFEPLLKKAVQDTILLLFSPYDFFNKEIFNHTSTSVSVDGIRETSKYIKINQHLSNSLILRLEQKGGAFISGEEGIKILNEVCEQTGLTPDDFDDYIPKFSEVQPLSVDMIYIDTLQKNQAASVEQAKDFFSESLNHFPADEASPVPSLNDKFFKKQETINDRLHNKVRATIAEIHYNKKIESIRQSLTINQKFMFIKELFKGNTDEFNKALENLDHFGSYDEAINYLKENFATRHNWNFDGEEAGELIGLVQKKYQGSN